MPTLVQLEGLGQLEIPDEYNTQQFRDAIALANLQNPAFQAIDQELIGINNLLSEMERGGLTPPKFTPTSQEAAQVSDQDRTYLGEILAGLRSGAQFAVGSGLSGIERISERVGLDPTGDEEGWISQAGDALKRGAQEIQASEDKETLFKFSNAFGSILGFAAPAIIAAPISGGASLGFAASLAAGSGADEAFERAKEAGATDEQLTQATLFGAGVGLTEVLAPIKAINRIKKMYGGKTQLTSTLESTVQKIGTKQAQRGDLAANLGISDKPFKDFGVRIAKTAGLEGSQEAVAAIAQNAIEKYIYNPDRELLDPAIMEEGLYGGAAGGTLAGIIESFGLRKARRVRKKFDEYTKSDEYTNIQKEVEADVTTLEQAEAAQAEALAEGNQQLADQYQAVINDATARIQRANELVTTSVMENVYGGPEVRAYLMDQKLEDGTPMYDENQLNKMSASELSEVYKRHVRNPATKYERDARDLLSITINPDTGKEFTFEEIEAVYDKAGPQGVGQLGTFIENLIVEESEAKASRGEIDERIRLRTGYQFGEANQNEAVNAVENDPSLDANQRLQVRYNLLSSIREARKAGVSNARIMKAIRERNTIFANEAVNNVRKLIPKEEVTVEGAPEGTTEGEAAPEEGVEAAPEEEVVVEPEEEVVVEPEEEVVVEPEEEVVVEPAATGTTTEGEPVAEPVAEAEPEAAPEAETPKLPTEQEQPNAAAQQTIRDIKKDFARIVGVFGSDQEGAQEFEAAIESFRRPDGRINVAALANSGVLIDADGSNLLSGYSRARATPYAKEFQNFLDAYAKGEVGQYLGDGNIQDVTSFENVMITDQKAATDGVVDSAAIQNLKNAILRMVGPIRADRAEELAIYIGQEANRYLARNSLGAATIRFNKEGEQPFVKTPYGYVEVGGDFDGRQGVPTRIAIQTKRLPTSEHGFPESFNDYSRLLGVTYHEAFHAGKRLVLTQDDQALLDRVITPEFAMRNGVSKEWFDAYPPEQRLEEAQAQIFSLWAAGVPIKGMQAPVRRRLKTLKDFFDAVSSWARGEGFIKKIVDLDATSEIEQVKKLFEDFDSGELARQAGRLDDQALKKYAGINAAPNYEALVGAPIKRTPGFGGVANPFKDGFFNNSLRDLGFFGRLISHPSDLAQKNPLFRAFYNTLQKRVQIRNIIKGASVKIGAEPLRALNRDQRQLTSVMVQLANNGEVEPTIDIENGTVKVSIPQTRYDGIEAEYGTENRFLSMLGVDPSTVSIQKTEEGVTFTLSGQPEVAKAVAGVRSTSNFLSNNLFTSILHSFINGRELKESGLADIIRTIDDAGQPANYNNVLADLRKFLDVDNNPFLERVKEDDGSSYIRIKDSFKNATIEEKKAAFPGLKEEYLAKPEKFEKLNDSLQLVQELLASRKEGYFPNYRYGDTGIIVRNKDGDVVYFETVPSTFLDRFGSRKKDRLNEIRSELQAQYPGMTVSKPFKIEYDEGKRRFGGLSEPEQAALFASLNILEEIALRKAGTNADDASNLLDEVANGLFAKRIDGLIKPRQNIPGYVNSRNNDGSYLLDSFVRSIDTTSNTASSLFTEPELFGSLDALKDAKGTQPKYYDRADEIYNYVNNPRNEAPMARAFAFHMFLGFNVSSALVNLTQTFQATYPVLGAITGLGSGGVYVAKALKDSSALYGKMLGSKDKPSVGEYGFSFFKTTTAPDGTVSVEVDMDKKPDSVTEEEYRYLAELFRTGIIQPIQNIDLGAARLQELDVRRGVAPVLNASGYAFGVIENTNRIAAALAFYRAAKDPKNRKNFEAFVSGTRFGDQDVSRLDTEDFAKLMGTMGVEKTQFFMGQENRPAIMQGPVMSVVTQFQSFLYQMVGMYGDALFKSLNGRMDTIPEALRPAARKIAMKQLAAMTLSMMAFGGAMGLPFMENLKEIIKFFTEQFGDQVGEDFEEELRVTLGETMGYTATDALLRGIPRMLGADVSRRTGYGDVAPIRLLMGGDPVDFAGPAISRAVDMVKGTKEAYDNGDLLGAAVGVMPIAARNAYDALVKEPSVGTFTARGQQLLPAGSLSGTERLMKTFGFTPTTVSRARERRGLENYLSYRSKVGKDVYTNRMSKNLGAYLAAVQKGDGDSAANFLAKYYTDFLHTMQHDFDNIMEPSRQYRINPQTPMNRVMRAMEPFGYGTGPRVPKAVRPELLTRILGEAAYSE